MESPVYRVSHISFLPRELIRLVRCWFLNIWLQNFLYWRWYLSLGKPAWDVVDCVNITAIEFWDIKRESYSAWNNGGNELLLFLKGRRKEKRRKRMGKRKNSERGGIHGLVYTSSKTPWWWENKGHFIRAPTARLKLLKLQCKPLLHDLLPFNREGF